VSTNPSRRVAALLFAVAWGSNHFVPLLIVYRVRLHLSAVELATLFGVYAVGLVPGLVLGGPLSDTRGRRTVVLPAAAVALLGTSILAWGSYGFGVLLAGRFVVGLGAGATFSAGTAWVQDLAAREPQGTGARRAAVALSSGFGGGPLMAGLCAQWLPWPMTLPYLVQGTVVLPLLVRVALLPAAPSPQPLPVARPEGTVGAARWLPAGFGSVAIVAPWVFAFPSIGSAVLPAQVRPALGSFSVAFAGVVTATSLASGVLVQPFLRRRPPRSAAIFGVAMGSAGLLCGTAAAAATSPIGVLVAAPLLGAGYGGCLISGLRFIETNTQPSTRGRVTGLYYAMTYLGFSAPLALAALARHIGDTASLLVLFALAIVPLGVAVRVRDSRE
jgi:MFS family permease